MPRKKRKRETPKTTAYVPPSEECPDVDDMCIREVVEEILLEKIGHTKLDHTTIISPVKLELLTKGGEILEEWYWDTEDWPCLQEFLDDIRSRLTELIDSQLPTFDDESMEIISEQVRRTLLDRWGIDDIGELVRPSDAKGLATAWLRDTLGLERRVRPLQSVAQISRRRLSRWSHPTEASIVRQARAITAYARSMR